MNDQQYTELSWQKPLPKGIHHSVKFGKNVVVGMNVIIEENVTIRSNAFLAHNINIRPNAVIGKNVQLRSFVHVDPDAVIGDNTHVFPYALVGGGWKIGKNVWYGPYSLTTNSSMPTVLNPSEIGDYSIIYSHCCIAPGVSVGAGAVLGMKSLLMDSIPPMEMWYGSPAKFQREVKRENLFIKDDEPWPEVLLPYVMKKGNDGKRLR